MYGGDYRSPEERQAVTGAERALEFRNFEEAYRLALQAMEDFPGSLEAIRTAVSAAQQMNRTSGFMRRIEALPEERAFEMHYAVGWWALLAGDPRTAANRFEMATDVADGREDFELQRAKLVAWRAIPGYDGGIVLDSYRRFVETYRHIGLAHVSHLNTFNFHGDESAHQRALEAAFEAGADHPEIYIHKERWLSREDFWYDPAEGLDIINEGLEKFPDSTKLALKKVNLLRKLGRQEQALELTRQWRGKAPNHGDFLSDEITLLSDLMRWDEAIATAQKLDSLQHQARYSINKAYKLGRLLHYAGRDRDAIEVLTSALTEGALPGQAEDLQRLLVQLQSNPGARVSLVPDVGTLMQRGNYCGPATMNMILRRWGIELSQEEIAKDVYTGVAGTPPQVIHNYAKSSGLQSREFTYDPDRWKALIDAGFPILWLQMLGERGGHYRVIVGYDDALDIWLVKDPNNYFRTEVPYNEIRDTWILPDISRSMVIYPPEFEDHPALEGLEPTTLVAVTNWVFYISTGSNLFVGLFPALPINTGAAFLLSLVIGFLLRRITFPENTVSWLWVAGSITGFSLLANLLIGVFRLSGVVGVLLSFHLALLTLIPLLLLVRAGRKLAGDFLHVRESAGICALTMLTWLSLAFIDRDPWQWIAPVVIFATGIPIMIYPRIRIRMAQGFAERGDYLRAMDILRPYGAAAGAMNYFAAARQELTCRIVLGEWKEAGVLAEILRRKLSFSRKQESNVFTVAGLIAQAGCSPSSRELHDRAIKLLDTPEISPSLQTIVRAAMILLESSGEIPEEQSLYINRPGRVEETLRDLSRLVYHPSWWFTSIPMKILTTPAIQRVIMLIAVTGAIRLAHRENRAEDAAALWDLYGKRFQLEFKMAQELSVSKDSDGEKISEELTAVSGG